MALTESLQVLGTTADENHFYFYLLICAAYYESLEAIFLFTSSFLFMMHLDKSPGKPLSQVLITIILKHDGMRFILIMMLNLLCAALAITAALNGGRHNYMTHAGLFLPAWIYSLALYSFIQSSYITAKRIIVDAKAKTGQKLVNNRYRNATVFETSNGEDSHDKHGYPDWVVDSGSLDIARDAESYEYTYR
jgi:hypothetical protein